MPSDILHGHSRRRKIRGMGITRQQALDCFASDDLIGIGMEADAVRRRLHPEGVVTYSVDGRFDLGAGLEMTSQAHVAAVGDRIEETLDRGGSGIVLKGEAG